ncbi:hypothetical protein FH972_021273 [Carpinus fangiana]|uniref:Uncharacterized protein n=1 Tax=Carpinus fangiana TaxID=176857 RepID=A0A5N6KPF7_9ROSI|nr:hypothetical protein FH972_021273 [Carpinus fangiana]
MPNTLSPSQLEKAYRKKAAAPTRPPSTPLSSPPNAGAAPLEVDDGGVVAEAPPAEGAVEDAGAEVMAAVLEPADEPADVADGLALGVPLDSLLPSVAVGLAEVLSDGASQQNFFSDRNSGKDERAYWKGPDATALMNARPGVQAGEKAGRVDGLGDGGQEEVRGGVEPEVEPDDRCCLRNQEWLRRRSAGRTTLNVFVYRGCTLDICLRAGFGDAARQAADQLCVAADAIVVEKIAARFTDGIAKAALLLHLSVGHDHKLHKETLTAQLGMLIACAMAEETAMARVVRQRAGRETRRVNRRGDWRGAMAWNVTPNEGLEQRHKEPFPTKTNDPARLAHCRILADDSQPIVSMITVKPL